MKQQFFKFMIVGVFNTFFGYGIYALFIFFGFNYIFALIFSTVFGVIFNFKTISRFVFNTKNNSLVYRFFAVYLVVLIFNLFSLKYLKDLGFNDYVSGLLILLPSAILSFVLNKFLVYKR